MKKLFVFALLVISCLMTTFSNLDVKNIYSSFPSATVSFYCDADVNKLPSYVTKVKNGNGDILSCSAVVAESVEKQLIAVNGKSITFKGSIKDYNDVCEKLNVKAVKKENVSNIYITYGYVNGEMKHVFLDGKKVNVQLAYNDGQITIGFPLILGSY